MFFKRKNKGFTLIELLMTITLLAIISVISFVSINAIIVKNKDNQCKIIVDNIKTATKDFFSDNRIKLLGGTVPGGVSYKSSTGQYTVTAKVLVDNNYISGGITDPYTSGTLTDDHLKNVSITVTLNADKTVKEIKIEQKVDEKWRKLFGGCGS